MSDTPLSATELAEIREEIHAFGFPSYSGLDAAGDSLTPWHEGRNDGIDDCFLATAHIVRAKNATIASLQSTLARLAEPDEAVVDGGRVRKTIEAMKAYLTFYEMDDPLNPPTLRQRAAREQGATRLRLWIYGLESAFPNTEPRTPEEAEAIKAAAAMAGEAT
jgi:hypothetical protein